MPPPISSSDPTALPKFPDATSRYAHQAMSRFSARLSGLPSGVALDDEQLAILLEATKDFFLDMPPSALNPALGELLKDALPKKYTDVDKPLRQQGNVAIALVEKAAKRFWDKQDSGTKVLLSIGAVAMLGVGAGIAGTRGMEELGLPTDYDFNIIGEALRANVGATFDSGFENPAAQAGLSSRVPLDGAFLRVAAGVKMTTDDPYVQSITASIAFSGKDRKWTFGNDFSYDVAKKTFTDRLAFSANIEDVNLSAGTVFSSETEFPKATLGARAALKKGITLFGNGDLGPDENGKLSYGAKLDLVAAF